MAAAALAKIERLEERIDRVAAGNTEISMGFGGVKFATLLELMEFAKLMAVSGAAVPVHLRGNPGTCLAVCTKALRFGFDPFSLAEHSYTMVKSTKVDGQWQDVETIAYDSFVIHAIIEAHGNVTGPLRPSYVGEGLERTCTVTGIVDGAELSVTSATLGEIIARIGRNDKGKLKGSPLWDSKPDQQLWYDTRRDWCRKHQPHILLGWYDRDELEEHAGPDRAKDVTPKPSVGERLKNKGQRGFNQDHVERETAGDADRSGQASAEPAVAASTVVEAGASQAPASETPQSNSVADEPTVAVGEAVNGEVANVFTRYAHSLQKYADPKALKKGDDAFFKKDEWPDDEALREKLRRIYTVHLKRIAGELDGDALAAALTEAIES